MSNKTSVQIAGMIRDMTMNDITAALMLMSFDAPETFLKAYNYVTDSNAQFREEYAITLYCNSFVYNITQEMMDALQTEALKDNKVHVIKAFRAFTNAALKETKDCAEYMADKGILKGPCGRLTWGDGYDLSHVSHR